MLEQSTALRAHARLAASHFGRDDCGKVEHMFTDHGGGGPSVAAGIPGTAQAAL
jgi:hypothetical protein